MAFIKRIGRAFRNPIKFIEDEFKQVNKGAVETIGKIEKGFVKSITKPAERIGKGVGQIITGAENTFNNPVIKTGITKVLPYVSTGLELLGTATGNPALIGAGVALGGVSGALNAAHTAVTDKDLNKIIAELNNLNASELQLAKEDREQFNKIRNTLNQLHSDNVSINTNFEKIVNDFSDLRLAEKEEFRGIKQEIKDLETQKDLQEHDDRVFEHKLLDEVKQEEEQLVGVIDDLAERLQESNIKEFKFDNFLDFMNQIENDDIVDFLARNITDFQKMSKKDQNTILDMAIQRGL